MSPDDLTENFRLHADGLPGSAVVLANRKAAMARFVESGFPTRRQESWRYTDLAPIARGEFQLAATTVSAPTESSIDATIARAGVAKDEAVLVFVNGSLTAQRQTSDFGSAVEVETLSESLERDESPVSLPALRDHPLAYLNLAFASFGARIRIAKGMQPARLLHCIFVTRSTEAIAVQPQLALELGENSQARIALHFLDETASANWVNLLTMIELERGARLELHRIQDYTSEQLHTELIHADIAADALLSLTCVDIGGHLVRNDFRVRLMAPGAACDLAGIALASADQHVDNHLTVEHAASHTVSEQNFRSIVGAHGRCVFNGKVVVNAGTKGIAANQSSDNLLLADTGEIDTKPELEIHADDVKCSHGATVGELDEAQLFYLRSRGIPDAAARGLLTLGFANTILQRTGTPDLSDRVASKFGLELPAEPNWKPAP